MLMFLVLKTIALEITISILVTMFKKYFTTMEKVYISKIFLIYDGPFCFYCHIVTSTYIINSNTCYYFCFYYFK